MLPHKVSDKERSLAAAITDLAKAQDKTLTGKAHLQIGGINATADITVAAKSATESRGTADINATIGASSFHIPVQFVYNQADKVQYYKLSNLDPLLAVALNPQAAVSTKIKAVAQKIDGKWLRLSADNMKAVTKATATKADTCTPQLLQRIQTDASAKESLAKLLASRTLFTIDDIKNVASNHQYTITVDADKAEDALDVLKQTELFQGASDCDDSYNPFKKAETATQTTQTQQSAQTEAAKPTVTLKIAINDDNQITALNYSATSPTQVVSADLTINSDKQVAVAMPKTDVVDYSTIADEVEGIFTALTTPPATQGGVPSNLVQPYAG